MGFSSRSVTRPASGRSAGTTCTAIRGASSDTRMTEAIAATARWQSCAIVGIATRTRAIKSFFLRLSETFDYTAGQHVDVRLTAPDGYTALRSYSIASAPSGSKVIELAIERLLDGEVSPFFHDVAQVGDTIELRGPLGGHFLWPGPSKQTSALDRRRLRRRAAHGHDPVSEGQRRAS